MNHGDIINDIYREAIEATSISNYSTSLSDEIKHNIELLISRSQKLIKV